MSLVDECLVQRYPFRPVFAPVEPRADDDRERHGAGTVGVVADGRVDRLVAVDLRSPVDRAGDGLRVGIEQQLGRVAPASVARIPWAVDPEAVALTGTETIDVAGVDEVLRFGKPEAGLVAVVVEQAELDVLGHLREDGEVHSGAVEVRPEGEDVARPDLHQTRESAAAGAYNSSR